MGGVVDSPTENTLEVTLIGTGGGYGESSVIHLGNNEWVVVDSCHDPISKESLPLKYLTEIGVDVANCVKLVICTHWHDDHILGLPKLLEACGEDVQFYFAPCTDREKFLALLEIDAGKSLDNLNSSSTKEFYNSMLILSRKGILPRRAMMDRLIYRIKTEKIVGNIYTLSPSDLAMQKFDNEIGSMIEIIKQRNRKLVNISPNARSIVTYIHVNNHKILLGADLEIAQDLREGWDDIFNSSTTLDEGISLFKIPHHGSINGYYLPLWNSRIIEANVATMTPWNRGRMLPKIEMLEKYATHSKSIYLTSDVTTLGGKPKSREASLTRLIREKNPTVREIKFKHGIIRNRIDIDATDNIWKTDLFGDAIHVNSKILSQ